MKKFTTEKLYHKKYPYKVELQLELIAPDNKKKYVSNKLFKSTDEFKLWKSFLQNKDYRLYTTIKYERKSKKIGSLVVYIKDQNDYNQFVNKFSSNIVEVTEPLNNQHLDKLLENTTIIFRKKLFYNKYKYSIRFFRNHKMDILDIASWISAKYDKDSKYLFRSTSWWPVLYIDDPDDLILINLSFSDRIKEINQIELLEDITIP